MLKYIRDNGIIDLSYVQEQIEMKKRQEFLKMHPYKIWQGKDGKWRTYLPDDEKGRIQRERNTQKEIESIVIDYWKQQEENPTIKEVFTEWNDRRLELQRISMGTYQRNIQIYNRHFKEFGRKRIKSVCKEDFEDFLEEQIPKYNLTSKAFSNLKTITRGFLKRAYKRKFISFRVEDIFDNLDTSDNNFKKNIKEDYQEVFNDDEMTKMLSYLIDNKDVKNLGILLMFVTGIRVGELVALRYEDFVDDTIRIRRTETRYAIEKGKNIYDIKEFPKSEAGVRTVIIPQDFIWIKRYLRILNPFEEYVFVEKGKRLTTNCIRRRLERVCVKLGIYKKSPHKIRKTYGSILLDNHIDNKLITEMMGHTDILCTEDHYHRNRKSIQQKSLILSNIPEFQAK